MAALIVSKMQIFILYQGFDLLENVVVYLLLSCTLG